VPLECKSESAREKLQSVDLKVTKSRLALLEALREGHGPFSPEDLFKKLGPSLCDLVTVYRMLTVFEEKGLVRRCVFGDGRMRYELQDNEHHHHHLVCRQCHSVKPLSDCVMKKTEESLSALGYRNLTHALEFFGTCPTCASIDGTLAAR
jgi:Fur family transcriptional regulator, ferric uptake regulator